MIGKIYLVKNKDNRVVPGLCIDRKLGRLLVLQIRKATKEDKFNSKSQKYMEGYNRGRKEKDQMKIRKVYETDTVFIGKPVGLRDTSTVMVKKCYHINMNQIIREISEVPSEVVSRCKELLLQVDRIDKLRKELMKINKKITLAQLNNEKYSHLETKADILKNKIGYSITEKRSDRSYLNYRETPSVRIKVFKG